MIVRDNKLSKDEQNLKDAMGDYESVAEAVAGKEQQLNFSNNVNPAGDLTDPNADGQTTVLDPLTISQQAQQKQVISWVLLMSLLYLLLVQRI